MPVSTSKRTILQLKDSHIRNAIYKKAKFLYMFYCCAWGIKLFNFIKGLLFLNFTGRNLKCSKMTTYNSFSIPLSRFLHARQDLPFTISHSWCPNNFKIEKMYSITRKYLMVSQLNQAKRKRSFLKIIGGCGGGSVYEADINGGNATHPSLSLETTI